MNTISPNVKNFFEAFEGNLDTSEPTRVASQYGDIFMFAGPQGAQAVKKDDFLRVIPKRAGFFKSVGLTSSTIQALEETRLDNNYILVKAHWAMRFEAGSHSTTVEGIAATYLLHQQADQLQIVFQLDHQDLMQRVQELGLLPAKSE